MPPAERFCLHQQRLGHGGYQNKWEEYFSWLLGTQHRGMILDLTKVLPKVGWWSKEQSIEAKRGLTIIFPWWRLRERQQVVGKLEPWKPRSQRTASSQLWAVATPPSTGAMTDPACLQETWCPGAVCGLTKHDVSMKGTWGGKYSFHLTFSSPSAGTEAGTKRESLVACSSPLLNSSDPPVKGGHHPWWAVPSYINLQWKPPHSHGHRPMWSWQLFSWGSLFPGTSQVCVKLTAEAHFDTQSRIRASKEESFPPG